MFQGFEADRSAEMIALPAAGADFFFAGFPADYQTTREKT